MKSLLYAIITAGLAALPSAQAANIYVDKTAAGMHTGGSWADACTNLQTALAAVSSNDVMHVAAGTYYPSAWPNGGSAAREKHFSLKNGVTVLGGYPAGGCADDERDPAANPTIFSGDLDRDGVLDAGNTYHVFYHPAELGLNDTAVLDGIVVSGGNAGGSGVHANGGGMYNAECAPTLSRCTFADNMAKSAGGGLYLYQASPGLTGISFAGNTAAAGGGLYVFEGSPQLENCTLTGNLATEGGGLKNYGGSPELIGCSFAANTTGSAVYNDTGEITLVNCILWGNRTDLRNASGTISAAYSCIENGYAGTGNISSDPLFTDTAGGNLRLQAGSPCIDAGKSAAAGTEQDLDGNIRRHDDLDTVNTGSGTPPVDMGAYEYGSLAERPEIDVLRAGTSIADGGTDVIGEYEVGTVTLTYAVTNLQTDSILNLESIQADNLINVSSFSAGASLPAAVTGGQSAALTVSFEVLEDTGSFALDLLITNNDEDESDYTISIQGTTPTQHWYVDDTASGTGDGSSWANAMTNLQDAIEAAGDGETVHVAAGTYYPTSWPNGGTAEKEKHFSLKNGVTLLGGYPDGGGTDDERDPDTNQTICNGYLSYDTYAIHLFYHPYSSLDDSAVIDGFLLTKGKAWGLADNASSYSGGGMYNAGSPTIIHCTFSGNQATQYGGGVYNTGNPTLTNCTFSSNFGNQKGGGMYNEGNPTLIDCTFSNNSKSGIHNESGHATLVNCSFSKNYAYYNGGGISNFDYLTLINCSLSQNYTQSANEYSEVGGAAIYSGGTSAKIELINCSIGQNTVPTGEVGTGIYIYNNETAAILKNCIVWDSIYLTSSTFNTVPNPTVSYSCTSDGWSGTGNISVDPQFEDAGSDNLRLQEGSPCIDAGNSDLVSVTTDLDGNLRLYDNVFATNTGLGIPPVDMGAYETGSQPYSPSIGISRSGSTIASGGTEDLGEYEDHTLTLSYTIANTAPNSSTLTVGRVDTSNLINIKDVQVNTAMPVEVTTNADVVVSIDLVVSNAGAFSAELDFLNDSYNATHYTTTLSGTALGVIMAVLDSSGTTIANGEQAPIDFGSLNVNSSSPQVFTIQNSGSLALSLTGTPSVVISGSNEFDVTQPTATTLAADDGTTTFAIQFTPVSGGMHTGTVTIANNDQEAEDNPYTFRVSGSCDAPEIEMDQDSTIEFPLTAIGGTLSKDITIYNTGTQNLILSAVSLSGSNDDQFSILQEPDTTVAPGSSTTLTIQYAPSAEGTHGAAVAFTCNDYDESDCTFALSGEAILGASISGLASSHGSHLAAGMPEEIELSCTVDWQTLTPAPVYFKLYDGAWCQADVSDAIDSKSEAVCTFTMPEELDETRQLEIRINTEKGTVDTAHDIFFYPTPAIVDTWMPDFDSIQWLVDGEGGSLVDYVSFLPWFSMDVGDDSSLKLSLDYNTAASYDSGTGQYNGKEEEIGMLTLTLPDNVPARVEVVGGITGSEELQVDMLGFDGIAANRSVTMGGSVKATVTGDLGDTLSLIVPGGGTFVSKMKKWPTVSKLLSAVEMAGSFAFAPSVSENYPEYKGSLDEALENWEPTSCDGEITLDVQAALSVEVSKVALSVYAGLKTALGLVWSPDFDISLRSVYGYVGAKAEFFWWSISDEWGYTIYESDDDQSALSYTLSDSSTYTLSPISSSLLAWGEANRPANAATKLLKTANSDSSSSNEYTVLVENVAGVADPVLLVDGSGSQVLYVLHDTEKPNYGAAEIGQVTLSDASWESGQITTNSIGDYSPAISETADGQALAAWSRVGGDASAAASYSDVLPLMEITAAWQDRATGAWGAPMQLTTNGIYDREPLPLVFGEHQGVLWIQNSGTNLVGSAASGDRLVYSAWSGSEWLAPSTIWSNACGVWDMAFLADSAGEAHLIFTVDTDGDTDTRDDCELYLLETSSGSWQTAERLTDNAVEDSMPSLTAPNGELMCVWRTEDTLQYTKLAAWNPQEAFSVEAPVTTAPALDGVTLPGGAAIAYTAQGADGMDIQAAFYDAALDVWSQPRQLTHDTAAESALALEVDGEDLALTYLRNDIQYETVNIEIDGISRAIENVPQPGRIDLCCMRYELQADVLPSAIQISPDNPAAGNAATVTVTVVNSGDMPLTGFDVALYDGEPLVSSNLIGQAAWTNIFIAGTSNDVEFVWNVPNEAVSHVLYAVCDPDQVLDESDRSNNILTLRTGLSDLKIKTVSSTEQSATNVLLSATVVNQGVTASEACVIAWYLNGTNEVGRAEVPALDTNDTWTASALWSTAALSGKYTNVTVSVDVEDVVLEAREDNNEKSLTVALPYDETETGTLSVSLSPSEAVAAGARWRRSGTSSWLPSGYQEEGIEPGVYTLEFKNISPWAASCEVSVTISAGKDAAAAGTYIYTNLYTVSFDAQGGSTPAPETIAVSYGEAYGTLAAATCTGYTFDGWWTAASGGSQVTASTAVSTAANHTLYAHWTASGYTVSFDAQGGSSADSISVTYDDTYGTLSTPSRSGYTFNGWWTAASGGTQVTASTAVSTAADHTLYAHWTANDYTVSFDAQGGSSTESISVTYDAAYGTMSAPSLTGYTFAGWWTAASGGTQVTASTVVSTAADHTLYAHWVVSTYTVSFEAQGGSTPASFIVTVGSNYGTLGTTSRPGYTFNGWWTAASGGTQVTAATEVTTMADHTLYAHWTANDYTVSFDTQGGSEADSISVTYDAVYGTLSTPSRTGYTFDGWWTAADDGLQVMAATTVYTASNHTLYAHWTANDYTVSFEAQGGSAAEAVSVTFDAAYGALSSTARTGYTFAGWWTAPSGGSAVTAATIVSSAADHTLYAHWTVNDYIVSFDAQEGVDPDPAATNVTYDAAYGPLAETTRTGYTFDGWWTEMAEGSLITATTTVYTASNHTLYAHWSINSYPLTLHPGDHGVINEANSGSVYTVSLDYGTELPAVSVQPDTGYVFSGWSPALPDAMSTNAVEAAAQYQRFSAAAAVDSSCVTSNGYLTLDRQTGYFIYTFTLSNAGLADSGPIRISIAGLPDGVSLYGAQGTDESGYPYLIYNEGIASGASVEFSLRLISPDREQILASDLSVIVTSIDNETDAPAEGSTIISITSTKTAADCVVMSVSGMDPDTTYYLQYSSDLVNWSTSTTPLTSDDEGGLQIVDTGPPMTSSAPLSEAAVRFYRLIEE